MILLPPIIWILNSLDIFMSEQERLRDLRKEFTLQNEGQPPPREVISLYNKLELCMSLCQYQCQNTFSSIQSSRSGTQPGSSAS